MKSLKTILLNLLAKYEFWRAMRLRSDKDWEFMLDISNPEAFSIRILKKRWKSVIVEYSGLHMSDDMQMSFDMNVIANPNLKNTDSKAFKKFTTDIIRSIIVASVERAKEVVNENGTVDFVEPLEERIVHEEDDSVPEERVSKRKPRKKTL